MKEKNELEVSSLASKLLSCMAGSKFTQDGLVKKYFFVYPLHRNGGLHQRLKITSEVHLVTFPFLLKEDYIERYPEGYVPFYVISKKGRKFLNSKKKPHL